MAFNNDIRDILEMDMPNTNSEFVTKDAILNDSKKKKNKKYENSVKKPEGMHRELWGLLWTDNKDGPPIIPTDVASGYKQPKAKIGQSRVRAWKWMPFTNPARKDGAIFYHWRSVADEGLDYPFARFDKSVAIPVYSDTEYQQYLLADDWTRLETDHLFDLCRRFDIRFVIVHDRWDRNNFRNRSVEDLKERFYGISATLAKLQNVNNDVKLRVYDANHERKRKEQLERLFHRTDEQIEEEERLMQELKKIEQRKKEREKKALDLQKLITAAGVADGNSINNNFAGDSSRRSERKQAKKLAQLKFRGGDGSVNASSFNVLPETSSIKFADFKQSGVYLRSQRMKLPLTIGQKKTKTIEQMLEEFGIDQNPIPTQNMVTEFNDLRQDIVLLSELRIAVANCEYELQTLRHRFKTMAPNLMIENSSENRCDGLGARQMDIN